MTFIRCLKCTKPRFRAVTPILVHMRQVTMKPILQAIKLALGRAVVFPK